MNYFRKRIQNRILQALYRPRLSSNPFMSGDTLSFLDELENAIEENVTPLLSELF